GPGAPVVSAQPSPAPRRGRPPARLRARRRSASSPQGARLRNNGPTGVFSLQGGSMKAFLFTLLLSSTAFAQGQRPAYETTKVDGTDGVYVFRAGNHQAMFVVTKAGVIATDPLGYGRPEMVKTYLDEIKKVTDK